MNKYRVTASSLNIRKDPTTSSTKIGSVLKGEIVEPIAREEKWSKIKKDGVEGWVYNNFLELVTEDSTLLVNNIDSVADFFITKLLPNPKYNFADRIDDKNLLYNKFLETWKKCVIEYKKKYPTQDLTFTETYRSNALQKKYFDDGASKIERDGMHHYGIAGDTIFIIDGKRTYNGDVALIRKIYKEIGLTIIGTWDPLHVQFIPVEKQQTLRNSVKAKILLFQKKYGLSQTGIDDAATIAKAKEIFT